MLKKFVLAAMVVGSVVLAGCSACNKCQVEEPCNTCETVAAPCGATCDN
jgi:outer membrane murein-binding lipoprotein Lpp